MHSRAIIIACVAVAVLYLAYWFALGAQMRQITAPTAITGVLAGLETWAGTNGNYTWAGTKTPKGEPIFKSTAGHLAEGQSATRLCVRYSPVNARCWNTDGAVFQGVDNHLGAFDTPNAAQGDVHMSISVPESTLTAALATAPASNGRPRGQAGIYW